MSTTDEIFNYVMNTPCNTNPAVLKSKLNSLAPLPFPTLSITKPQDCVMSVTSSTITIDNKGNYVEGNSSGQYYIPGLQMIGSANLYGFYAQVSADSDIYNVVVNGTTVNYNGSSHKYMIQVNNSTYNKPIEVVITKK